MDIPGGNLPAPDFIEAGPKKEHSNFLLPPGAKEGNKRFPPSESQPLIRRNYSLNLISGRNIVKQNFSLPSA
jgi:hypothetical protein